jgi:DNA-binding response OmpR family regulator
MSNQVVLDLGLPGGSGLEVLHIWRERANIMPVLIPTARDAWHERVDGLRAGADDYPGKPFYVEELIARFNVMRLANQEEFRTVLQVRQQLIEYTTVLHHRLARELRRARLAGLEPPSQRLRLSEELPALVDVLHRIYQDKGARVEDGPSLLLCRTGR